MADTDSGREVDGGGSWPGVDDAALARGMRASADDSSYGAAWREFERRYLGNLRGFIEARGSDLDYDACEDVLALTVERIQHNIDAFTPRGPRSLLSWSFAIAQNVLKDAWRGRHSLIYSKGTNLPELVSFDEIAERYVEGLVAGDDAEAALFTAARARGESDLTDGRIAALWAAFASLPDVDRAVLWCRIVHADSAEAVAALVGKPVDHVRKIQYKAVRKLAKRYQNQLAKSCHAS